MTDPQHVQPPKKGMSPLAWVAIGCVGLMVLGAVGIGVAWVVGVGFVKGKAESFAERFEENPELEAVKMAVRFNPEVEMVSSDQDRRTVTLRSKKTGEEVTLDFEDARQGVFRFGSGEETAELRIAGGESGVMEVRGREGTMRLGGGGEVPDWVPVYPGTQPQGVFSQEDGTRSGGMASLQTSESLDRVAGYYRERLETLGYEVSETRFSGPDGQGALVAGENKGARRTLSIALEGTAEGTRATITYQGAK